METQTIQKTSWIIDPVHTGMFFKVRHLVISTVTGKFNKFKGSMSTNGDSFDKAEVELHIDANSIQTNKTDRDNHLRSPDFFDVEKYPEISFAGILTHQTENTYLLNGSLTIRGITKYIKLDVQHGGIGDDPQGNTITGFDITGTLNRKDFGLMWNTFTETGGVMVGDEVKLDISVALKKDQ